MKHLKISLFILLAFLAIGVVKINAGTITEDITVSVDTPLPDLTADIPTTTPSTPTVGVVQTFYSTIRNIGNASTSSTFKYFWQVRNITNNWAYEDIYTGATAGPLSAGGVITNGASLTYTFSNTDKYEVRVCVDKTSYLNEGTISESNEENNCSGLLEFTPTSPVIPAPNLKITAWVGWEGDGRSVVFEGIDHVDGPVELYEGQNYAVSWGKVDGAVNGCTLDGVSISTNGETVNTYTANVLNKTHTLTCKDSNNVSYTDTVSFSMPPAPLTFTSACSSDGKSVTLNWTLPSGYTNAYVRGYTPFIIDAFNTNTTTVSVNPDTTYSGIYLHTKAKTNSAWGPIRILPDFRCSSPVNLTAYPVSPNTAYTYLSQKFSGVIENIGGTTSGGNFPYYFQLIDNSEGSTFDIPGGTAGPLTSGASVTVNSSYTFQSPANYYSIRLCVDKSASYDGGVITESNENDNCSTPTSLTVSNPTTSVSVSASPLRHDVLRGSTVSLTYTTSTSTGNSTQCRVLNYDKTLEIKSYSTANPILITAPNSVGAFGYYIQCMDSVVQSSTGISDPIIVATKPQITFNKNGGTTDASFTSKYVNYGSAINVLPSEPTKTGYDFLSWNTSPEGTDLTFLATTPVYSDLTVFAQWKINEYTVTATSNVGGTILPSSVSVPYGSNTQFTITPDSVNGYYFKVSDVTSTCGTGSLSGNIYTTASITANCNVNVNFSRMSATLTTPSNNVIIPGEGSTYNAVFSWSITNPMTTPTAITSSNTRGASFSTSNNVSTSLATPQSGSKTIAVPYGTNNFYLYNNGVSLVSPVPVTVSCNTANGYYWNGSSCVLTTYTVSTSVLTDGVVSGVGGIVSPYTSSVVNYGTNTFFNFTLSTGYKLNSFSGCGVWYDSSESAYVVENVKSDCTVTFDTRKMTGALSPSSTSCTIVVGSSSCYVQLSSVVNNAIGPSSAVTANAWSYLPTSKYPALNISVANTSSNSVVVPYSSRTFYLYNNAIELDQKTVTASCVLGSSWDSVTNTCKKNQYLVSTSIITDGILSNAGGSANPSSATVDYGNSTSFSITTNPGYSLGTVSGCGGTLSGSTFTTSSITSACEVSISFTLNPMIGTLTPVSDVCYIPLNSDRCNQDIVWYIEVPRGLTTAITSSGMTDRVVSTNMAVYQSGTESFAIPYLDSTGTHVSKFFQLYNNGVELATTSVRAECGENTIWNNKSKKCTSSVGDIIAENCVITQDTDNCDSKITWTTEHPIVVSEVTTPNNIVVATGNNGTTTYPVSCSGSGSVSDCQRTFFLYNGGDPELGQATATARCSIINKWNVNDKVCRYQSPILTLNATPCTIPLNGSSCNTILSWNTEYSDQTSVLKKGSTVLVSQNSNSGYYQSLPFGSHSFTLTNKESVVEAVATVRCADYTHWNSSVNKCLIDPPSPDNITFTAIPSIILPGKSSTLSWDASKVIDTSIGDTCTIGEQKASESSISSTLSVGSSGSKKVTPSETTTYTLTCKNSSGEDDNPLLIKVVSITVKEN